MEEIGPKFTHFLELSVRHSESRNSVSDSIVHHREYEGTLYEHLYRHSGEALKRFVVARQ